MYNEQAELDTIKSEHFFIMAGDFLPVNAFDNQDLHLEMHKAKLEELKKSILEPSKLSENQVLLLEAHIALHEQTKKRI